MTIQKAIKILDWWIIQKKQAMVQLQKEWVFFDDSHNVEKTLLEIDKIIIANLETIKKELIPICKHPENMRDIVNGKLYCMNCNFDL
ncbi:Hypothetical protein Nlim_1811 [Candidatus Nitrosarchaeum limnium SFB1]|jgi:hypothetical protein|uniref:Uncharacterized protein n=1 Tax=Candidatus Nitrosarchaeum limnium SFB1 TaxID=886738 RepID=F3KMR0_9ARCH|nr:Hypothetical protein Nlim_1811 [Candidatus Nitrosarchaeum limnium SFB1]